MAKLNGVELKNIKTFRGLDGEGFQGTLYLNGRKIGFFTNMGDGAAGHFETKDGEKSIRLPYRYYKDAIFDTEMAEYFDEDMFMDVLFFLCELEKHIKKMGRDGFVYTAVAWSLDTFELVATSCKTKNLAQIELVKAQQEFVKKYPKTIMVSDIYEPSKGIKIEVGMNNALYKQL